ncbi:MAG: hypothetical protein IIC90_13325 [Chloroflexi bacterium]|nr:hypothetical protein [Chloroflexota bacterium]
MRDLTSASLKLSRAEEQAGKLEAEFADFFSTENKAHSILVHKNSDASEWWVTWHINKVPPDLWPVQIGEIVHNLRCALDYLVYEFSTSATGKWPVSGTAFPIFLEEKAYRSSGQGGGPSAIRGLTPEARAIVDRCQPFTYEIPEAHYLWDLKKLSNGDKHRFVNVATTYDMKSSAIIQFEPKVNRFEWITSGAGGILEDGGELFRIRVAGATPETVMRWDPHLDFNNLFDESTPAVTSVPVMKVLNGTGRFVGAVINEFARL